MLAAFGVLVLLVLVAAVGAKGDGYPLLLPRPIAFPLFTIVANPEAVGRDVIRAHGQRPCVELENPVLCHPS